MKPELSATLSSRVLTGQSRRWTKSARSTIILVLICGSVALACGGTAKPGALAPTKKAAAPITTPRRSPPADRRASAAIEPVQSSGDAGTSALRGIVNFVQRGTHVELSVRLRGCPPGSHGFHLHEGNSCGIDAVAAGGHWNPAHQPHGQIAATNAYHAGDLGNILCDDLGQADLRLTLPTSLWTIGTGDSSTDILGHAVIIHAGQDDPTAQPTGNAGGRIGCGVIKRD